MVAAVLKLRPQRGRPQRAPSLSSSLLVSSTCPPGWFSITRPLWRRCVGSNVLPSLGPRQQVQNGSGENPVALSPTSLLSLPKRPQQGPRVDGVALVHRDHDADCQDADAVRGMPADHRLQPGEYPLLALDRNPVQLAAADAAAQVVEGTGQSPLRISGKHLRSPHSCLLTQPRLTLGPRPVGLLPGPRPA